MVQPGRIRSSIEPPWPEHVHCAHCAVVGKLSSLSDSFSQEFSSTIALMRAESMVPHGSIRGRGPTWMFWPISCFIRALTATSSSEYPATPAPARWEMLPMRMVLPGAILIFLEKSRSSLVSSLRLPFSILTTSRHLPPSSAGTQGGEGLVG